MAEANNEHTYYVDEDMLGSLTSVMSEITRFESKILLIRTTIIGNYKMSLRRSPKVNTKDKLGAIIHEVANLYDGTGGGHESAADCKIPTSQLKIFLKTLNKRLNSKNEN